MEWSTQQSAALKQIGQWLDAKGSQQVFRLFGYAGTGKTTIAIEAAALAKGAVIFCAFTGKAALVMASKGCVGAQTIHSLIYKPIEDDDAPGRVRYVLNPDSPAAMAKLIIVDECSMVDETLGMDLLSFGKRVLVLGDPAQLPPVRDEGFFIDCEPDVMLTEIHRQALDNPIIRMSMDVREGRRLALGQYGSSKVITRSSLTTEEVTGSDQIIVGLNRTRRRFNTRVRELRGHADPLPMDGDRLVCLRNNREKGLLNGGLWDVDSVRGRSAPVLKMKLTSADTPSKDAVDAMVPREFFDGDPATIPYPTRRKNDEFDYGYVLTCHKSQGSQFGSVTLFDESAVFREHRARWLYTGITRAAERITIVT